MTKTQFVCAATCGVAMALCGVVTTADATLIAYDSFSVDGVPNNGDYNAAPLVGPAGTHQDPSIGSSGFVGAWFGNGGGTAPNTGANIANGSGGLTHPNMTGTPLLGQTIPGNNTNNNTRRVFRNINYTPTNGNYYMSFLMRKTVANTTYDYLMGLTPSTEGTESSWSTTNGGIYLGMFNGGIGFSSGSNTTTTLLTAANMNVNETYLGLMQINLTAGTDSVDVSIYDSSSALVASQTFSSLNLNIPSLSVARDGFNGAATILDEFRFGTELSDVFFTASIVPEPGTSLLLAPGLLGLLVCCWRRRRR